MRPGDVLLVPLVAEALGDPVGSSGANTAQTQGSGTTGETVAVAIANTSDTTAAGGATASATGDDGSPETIGPSGALVWPHPGVRETYDGRFRGVVMTGQSGDTFRSVTSGVVSFVGPFTSFGKLILVRAENGYLYGYAGADRVDVQLGDRITNGTVLGSVGISPAFQSAQVLFTVWRDNRYIDPERAPRG